MESTELDENSIAELVRLDAPDVLNVSGVCFFPFPGVDCDLVYGKLYQPAFNVLRNCLFAGGIVNGSEQRAAWHTACREPDPSGEVKTYLQPMQQWVDCIRNHTFNDLKIHDVVNIGIGGSDLGPKLVCEAFADAIDGPRPHFVSNLDSAQLQSLLKSLDARHTLFIVTSKSFTTLETLENWRLAQQWLEGQGCQPSQHVIGVTQQVAATQAHGIPAEQTLDMPEWVGGRFSLWSAVGLSCAIALGFDRFSELLAGAHAMDQHFLTEEISDNMPLSYAAHLYALIHDHGLRHLAVLPYCHQLRSLSEYLQQLFMESLGKSVNTEGAAVSHLTGPVVFGGPGTNCQHSYQQLMMQGSHRLQADFILPLQQAGDSDKSRALMAANCLTQVRTLREGAVDHEQPQKSIRGQQLANLFVLEQLTPRSLGALLAMYEHAVFSLGYLMDINPFDQWGVERAKQDSKRLYAQMQDKALTLDLIKQVL